MKIRYKILLILALTMLILFSLLYYVAQTTVLASVKESENARASSNALRFIHNLNFAINAMNNSVNDWAKWDETYSFLETNNLGYIETNLIDDTFENLEINMMLLLEPNGNLRYGKMYDLSNSQAIALTESMIQQVTNNKCLFTETTIVSKEGLIALNGVPMLIAAHSILPSDMQEPPNGILVMGRYLDESEIAHLATLTGLPVTIELLGNNQASSDFQSAKRDLSIESPILTQTFNETAIAGYVLVGDIEGNPLLIARIVDYRTEYTQGTSTVNYVGGCLFGIIAVLFIAIIVLLDKIVISRLSDLNDTVIRIKRSQEKFRRLKVRGNDELSSLSQNINSMLDVIDNHTQSLEKTVNERTKDLYENQQKLRSILLASPDAIVATDLNGNITECNAKMSELFGVDREMLIGASTLDYFDNTQRELLEKSISDWSEIVYIKRFETILKKRNNETFPAEVSINRLLDENEKLVGYVAIARDLSERKELEQRLFKSERLAAIGELAGMVGHDLRNPLTAIKNAHYYINKKCAECRKKSKQMLDIIDNSIEHSNKIINDLLEYSRELYLERTRTSPKALLQEALSLINVPTNVNLHDYTTDVKLFADKPKLVRVFVNMIKNALDAMPQGGTLEITSKKKNGNVEIAFTDTGTGIPEDVMPKLFTPLLTTKAKGMGFGLAISKRLVEAHGGKISVDSIKGKGTTFTVTFPIKPPPAETRANMSAIILKTRN